MKRLVLMGGLLVVAMVAPAWAQEQFEVPLEGEAGYFLKIAQDDAAMAVTVSLIRFNNTMLELTIGNAAVTRDAVQTVRLCAGCDPVVFIPAYDRSSAYSAETGILVWSRTGVWDISILPLKRPVVRDEDGDGAFELVDVWPEGQGGTQRYEFREGLLSVAEPN